MEDDKHYTIEYHLKLEDGSVTSYAIEIDKETMISSVPAMDEIPDWVRTGKGNEYCPIALRLVEPIRRFNGLLSHARAVTTVVTPERNYVKECDVQEALSSLFGLIMATSGSPQMQPFKHMARYHLPFSTLEETIYRITSTYLMRQLLNRLNQEPIVIDLKDIESLYTTMRTLNESMAARLKEAVKWGGDGTVNAVVILNTYSSLIPVIIREELEKLRPFFK
jgi:hypothetical protein